MADDVSGRGDFCAERRPRDDSEYIGKASGLVRATGGRDLSYKDPPDFSGPRASALKSARGGAPVKTKKKQIPRSPRPLHANIVSNARAPSRWNARAGDPGAAATS